MSHIVIIGAGIAGTSAAFELRHKLDAAHRITLINPLPHFSFVPSNPWVAVGWRTPAEVTTKLAQGAEKNDIALVLDTVARIAPAQNRVELARGDVLDYDYLVIATGPELAFDEIEGLGPVAGHTQSICTVEHAAAAWARYEEFLKEPGPIVVGAAQGASCFGPAYEFAFILDADLRKRRLRDKVPMTFVTSEPYIGHLGLGGVGDSKGLLESELRMRHIKWITNAAVKQVAPKQMTVVQHDERGQPTDTVELPFAYAMMLPAFRGVPAVKGTEGLCNPRGFALVDELQRNPTHHNVYAAGVCIAIPPVEQTPVPTGTPKTGYMIETMVTAIAHNIAAEIHGETPKAKATWNAICLADMGDTGIAFVALPQIPPRNVTWAKKGKWVHVAKVALEKYFLHKVRSGKSEPAYERHVLAALGIGKLHMPPS